MSLRFRKSIKLAPGIRWNLSGSGSSWTVGPRGSSISIGKRGTFLNTGIPGTGLSWRTQLSAPTQPAPRLRAPAAAPATVRASLTCEVEEDGSLVFKDAAGKLASPYLIEEAKKQKRDALIGLIRQACDEVNGKLEALGRLHHDTPDPHIKPQFSAPAFELPEPCKPSPTPLRLLDKLFSGRKARIQEADRLVLARYGGELRDWTHQREEFAQAVARRKLLVERLIYQSNDAMEIFLEESLHDVVWPRETTVRLEVRPGPGVMLDIDLPEIEDMPSKSAVVPARGLKLSVKELSATKVKRLYADHVHGIVFRMVGEAFAALPAVQWVCASGYSQRRDPATAQLRDEYLLSVRVDRSSWELNDFKHLEAIDVVEALARFELRRDMTKAGQMKAIVPHEI